jgi:PAS domain S-box-containing protein
LPNPKKRVLTQDINQRELLKRRIEESERRYRGLYESSPIALTVTDSNGVILDVNSATEEIFGFKKSEVIGKKYFNLGIYSLEQVERFKKEYIESLEGKKIIPREIQITRKDGTNAWLSVQNFTKKIGNEILVEGIAQDITERKIAEQKLIESEEKYRNLADSLPEVIFEIDLSYNITYTNSIASKIFGYSNEEFKKGMKMLQFLSFDDKELVLKQTQQIFRGEYVKPLVLKLKRKDGMFFFANIYASRVFKDKKVVGVRCIIQKLLKKK